VSNEKKISSKIMGIANGDIVDFDFKNRTSQNFTKDPDVTVSIGVNNLHPLVQLCHLFYVVKGTSSHTGGNGFLEELIAKDFDAVKNPETGKHSWWALPLKVDDLTFDIAHTTNTGGLPWTRDQAAMKLAAKTLFSYAKLGYTPPDFVIRSHGHISGDSHDAYPTRALITPAWQLKTEYVYSRAEPGSISLSDFGGIIIRVDGDKYEVQMIKYKPERIIWQIPEFPTKN